MENMSGRVELTFLNDGQGNPHGETFKQTLEEVSRAVLRISQLRAFQVEHPVNRGPNTRAELCD